MAQSSCLNASKDRFFSILARDLRSPFNPLLGMARSLAQTADMTPPAQIKETVERILHSAQNVYDLLENLLKWLSIQGGQIEYEPESLSLKEISERNSRLLAETAVNKQITLRCVLADTLYVYADKNMLETVIRNLTSNALKFTAPGGQVTITAQPDPTSARLIVISASDKGVGITPGDQAKLFKPDVPLSPGARPTRKAAVSV